MIFRFNIVGGPLLGYISFCQILTIAVTVNVTYLNTVLVQLHGYRLIAIISISLSAVWSLDFNGIIPAFSFCISDKLEDFDVLFLNYIMAGLSPLSLLVCSYILIQLHARGVKVVVICWKPFHRCFGKVCRNWSSSDSIIHAFASLMFLSVTTLNYNAYQLLAVTKIYTDKSVHALKSNVLLSYPTMDSYEPSYKCYLVLVLVLLFFLVFLPSLLLLLYPIQVFHAALHKCCRPRFLLKLNIFVETFQGTFKDGCNGTRDFRIIPGLVACTIVVMNTLCCIAHLAHFGDYLVLSFVIIFVLIGILCAYARPCKSSSANLSLAFHSLWLVASGACMFLWRQDFVLDTKVLAPVFVILFSVPHVVVLLWLCYRVEKKFRLCQGAVVCFCCQMRRYS